MERNGTYSKNGNALWSVCRMSLQVVLGRAQASLIDSAVTDSALTDSTVTDSALTDSGVTDSTVSDSAVTDSAAG